MYDYGVQLYAKKELTEDQLSQMMIPSPYESMETTEKLLAAGVVFFRDSEHAQGAFAEFYTGDGFYFQLFISEKTGAVLESVCLNRKVWIEWVKPDGVKRQFRDIASSIEIMGVSNELAGKP